MFQKKRRNANIRNSDRSQSNNSYVMKMFEEIFDSGDDAGTALDFAEDLERKSIKFYSEKASEMDELNQKDARDLFKFLVSQENSHLKAVLELKKNLGKKIDWKHASEIISPDLFAGFRSKRTQEIPIPEEILESAIRAEEDAVDFYTEFASKIASESGKSFFMRLAQFEKKHAELLDSLLALSEVTVDSAGTPEEF